MSDKISINVEKIRNWSIGTALIGVIAGAVPVTVAHGQVAGAQPEQTLAEHLEDQNAKLRLQSGRPQLDRNLRTLSEPRQADSSRSTPVASILQLDALLTPESRARLVEEGIIVQEYLGGTTYLVAITRRTDKAVSALEALGAAAAPLLPSDKIKPAALVPPQIPRELDREAERPEASLLVEFLTVVDDAQARAELERIGVKILRKLANHIFVVADDPEKVNAIAELPSVKVIDRGPTPFLPLNATARVVSGADLAQRFALGNPAPAYSGVTGKGVRMGIADSGVDENHDDFKAIAAGGGPGATRVYNPRPGSGAHGTHVASIAGGSGVNANANAYPDYSLRGQAPGAEIGDYAGMGASVSAYHAAIVTDRTDVTNHSYVQTTNGSYSSEAATIDKIMRGEETHLGAAIPAKPQVWAAGNNGFSAQYGSNEGYYSTFTSAKNTISVGSIDTYDLRISRYSSLGPSLDGRIKPDIVAPGCNDSLLGAPKIIAALHGSQGYTTMCGTSMAAPVVTGIVALMMEASSNAFGVPPKHLPSTYKALLVQTARDKVKTAPYLAREFNNPDTTRPLIYHAGPDFATGYGLVDAEAAVRTIADKRLWKEGKIGATGAGGANSWCMKVPPGSAEVKATLAWDDEAGSTVTTNTTPKLVNDLDIWLVAPDGAKFLAWTLNPLPLASTVGDPDPISTADVVPAKRGVDRRNNVEMVSVPLPLAGAWTVKVEAFKLPNGHAQPYSLAVSEPVSACP